MLHNEARNLLVEAYEKTHDAKGIALVYGVSVLSVYRLAEQKARTGSVDLRVNKRGRNRVLEGVWLICPEYPKRWKRCVKSSFPFWTFSAR